MKTRPGVVEDRQTAVIEGIVELDLIGGQEVLAFEGSGDEIAGVGGRSLILQTVRERGPSAVRKDSRTR